MEKSRNHKFRDFFCLRQMIKISLTHNKNLIMLILKKQHLTMITILIVLSYLSFLLLKATFGYLDLWSIHVSKI